MKCLTKHASAAIVALAAITALGQTSPVPSISEKFTISPATTIVDGPLNPDGTIDYIPAINALLGGAPPNDQNAALLLMQLESYGHPDEAMINAYKKLGAPLPADTSIRLNYFGDYKSHKQGTANELPPLDESLKESDFETRLRALPWSSSDYPDAAAWLKEEAPALTLAEIAATMPRNFIPWIHKQGSLAALDSMPSGTLAIMMAGHLLATRSMQHAGDGDFEGALRDIRTIRQLARLGEQAHQSAQWIFDVGAESSAFYAYAGLALRPSTTKMQLQQIRREIAALPPIVSHDETRIHIEQLLALDDLMICIRGDGEKLMRLMAWEFTNSEKVDLGDLDKIDWNVALKETIRLYDADLVEKDLPYEELLKQMDAKAAAEQDAPSVIPILDGDKIVSGVPPLERYLKMRANETKAAYSIRIAGWLAGGNTANIKTANAIEERGRLIQELAMTGLDLAQYRLDHGHFPADLKELGKPVPRDTFAGKDVRYRLDGNDFVLWSVGPNKKDGNGDRDDLVIRSAP